MAKETNHALRRLVRTAATSCCAVAVTLLALTACGGDDDDVAVPPPESTAPPASQRIETLDTAGLKRARVGDTEQPAISRLPVDADVARVVLPPLPAVKTQRAEGDKGSPIRIGVARKVAATATAPALAEQLHWQPLPDGGQVAAIDFAVKGAKGLRLGLWVQHLPPAAQLRFYGADEADGVAVGAADIARLRELNEGAGASGDAASLYWGPIMAGAEGRLELEIPAPADPEQVRLAVPLLSQLTQTMDEAAAKANTGIGAAGSCHIDSTCAPGRDVQSRAVARMVYTSTNGLTFFCSGTLLNDINNSQTPFFLTARHCISSQPEASAVQTQWFFRRATCDANVMDARAVDVGEGAELLFTDAKTDASLLRLRGQMPADVVYAGSYFGGNVPMYDANRELAPDDLVVGIHNPAGDVQMISFGAVLGYANCANDRCARANADNGSMLQVLWGQGSTEQGSSGSAIFAALGGRYYVVGSLHAGNASCSNLEGTDYYGRFDRAFAAGLGNWLTAR